MNWMRELLNRVQISEYLPNVKDFVILKKTVRTHDGRTVVKEYEYFIKRGEFWKVGDRLVMTQETFDAIWNKL